MQPNSYFVKITGKANISAPLEIGEGYKLLLDGEVVSESRHDNADGTFDVVATFKTALCQIEDKHGKITKAKDMRSRSTQLRRMVYRYWEADASSLDSDEAYDRFMLQVMKELPDIYERSK